MNLCVLLIQWISFNNLLHPDELILNNDRFQKPIIYSGPNFNLWRVSFHYFFNYFSLELTCSIFFVNMQALYVELGLEFWETSLMVARFIGCYLFYIYYDFILLRLFISDSGANNWCFLYVFRCLKMLLTIIYFGYSSQMKLVKCPHWTIENYRSLCMSNLQIFMQLNFKCLLWCQMREILSPV